MHEATKTARNTEMTELEARSYLQKTGQIRQNEIELGKEYQDKFIAGTSAKQTVIRYRAEKDYRNLLLKRLHQRSK